MLMRRAAAKDRLAFAALVERICAARTAEDFRAVVPDLSAFEGGRFLGEFGEIWLTRWSMLYGSAVPPEWPRGAQ